LLTLLGQIGAKLSANVIVHEICQQNLPSSATDTSCKETVNFGSYQNILKTKKLYCIKKRGHCLNSWIFVYSLLQKLLPSVHCSQCIV